MIHKYYSLKIEGTPSGIENGTINDQYLKSGVSLGLYKQNSFLEKEFLENFGDCSEDVFLFSELPEKDVGMGGGGSEHLIFDVCTNITYGIVGNFFYDVIKVQGGKLFKNLKIFLRKSHTYKPQTIAIKIRNQHGSNVTYKLPKYLTLKEIETAVEKIETDCGDSKTIESKFWTTLTFDTKSEEFKEE